MHIATASLYVSRYNGNGIEPLVQDKTRKPGKEKASQEKKMEYAALHAMKNRKGKPIGAAGHWQSGQGLGTRLPGQKNRRRYLLK